MNSQQQKRGPVGLKMVSGDGLETWSTQTEASNEWPGGVQKRRRGPKALQGTVTARLSNLETSMDTKPKKPNVSQTDSTSNKPTKTLCNAKIKDTR